MANLRDMVDHEFNIQAGGPGSGCHGPNCGRKGGGGTAPKSSTMPGRLSVKRGASISLAKNHPDYPGWDAEVLSVKGGTVHLSLSDPHSRADDFADVPVKDWKKWLRKGFSG